MARDGTFALAGHGSLHQRPSTLALSNLQLSKALKLWKHAVIMQTIAAPKDAWYRFHQLGSPGETWDTRALSLGHQLARDGTPIR